MQLHNILGHLTKENFAQFLSTLHAIFLLLLYIYILCYEYTILIFFLWCTNESMRKLSNARQLQRLWCCSHTIHLLNALHTRNKDVLMYKQGFIWITLRVQKRLYVYLVWYHIWEKALKKKNKRLFVSFENNKL